MHYEVWRHFLNVGALYTLGRYCFTLLGVVCSFAYLERTIKNYLVYCKKGNFSLCSHMPQSKFDVVCKTKFAWFTKVNTRLKTVLLLLKKNQFGTIWELTNSKFVRKFSYGYSRIDRFSTTKFPRIYRSMTLSPSV